MSAHDMRDALTLGIVSLLLLGAAAPAVAQEPAPVSPDAETLVTDADGVVLSRAWRFHPGDDPRWADPAFDDAGWEPVEPLMGEGKLPPGGWPGVGWFRRHLRIEQALWGMPLQLRVAAAGSADVYLDGSLINRTGAQRSAAEGRPPGARGPGGLVFSPRPDHVLAVRYSYSGPAPTVRALPAGFILSLVAENDAFLNRTRGILRDTALRGGLVTLLAAVALLHLALYWFFPRARENLFYSLFMGVFALAAFHDLGGAQDLGPVATDVLNSITTPFPVAVILLGLLTYYAEVDGPFPRTWVAFAVVAAGLAPVFYFFSHPVSTIVWCVYFGAVAGEVARIQIRGRTTAREGSPLFHLGMIVFAVVLVFQVLIEFGVLPAIGGVHNLYIVGVVVSAVMTSLSLARGFARTSVSLERRLNEVELLSGQLIEKERTAHENELRARLLEAEGARKSRDLEEGRALQLSMLPALLPEVEGLDIAAAMTTASEVGGDYYDFSAGPDGSLVVAVGDATGHGVAAGIMVTAVKAVLATVGGSPGLPEMVEECNRVLRGFHVKALHMCLTVARVTPRTIAVCSAGMAPALVWRAGTRAVEELGAGGLPLGSGLLPSYREQHAPLAPGDTVLFATDGFPELLDPAGNVLGFEGAVEALRGAAGAPARQVVERLKATATDWRGGREQADDITFVVVRVAK
jgi:serine phosphatase RsbU (regulator of sigma subunit)